MESSEGSGGPGVPDGVFVPYSGRSGAQRLFGPPLAFRRMSGSAARGVSADPADVRWRSAFVLLCVAGTSVGPLAQVEGCAVEARVIELGEWPNLGLEQSPNLSGVPSEGWRGVAWDLSGLGPGGPVGAPGAGSEPDVPAVGRWLSASEGSPGLLPPRYVTTFRGGGGGRAGPAMVPFPTPARAPSAVLVRPAMLYPDQQDLMALGPIHVSLTGGPGAAPLPALPGVRPSVPRPSREPGRPGRPLSPTQAAALRSQLSQLFGRPDPGPGSRLPARTPVDSDQATGAQLPAAVPAPDSSLTRLIRREIQACVRSESPGTLRAQTSTPSVPTNLVAALREAVRDEVRAVLRRELREALRAELGPAVSAAVAEAFAAAQRPACRPASNKP